MKNIEVKKINFFQSNNNNFHKQPAVIDLTNNHRIKKILIVKWGALGDLLISSAIMNDIYNAFPEAKIDLNTSPEFTGLFFKDKRFFNVWSFDVRNPRFKILEHMKWLNNVRKYKYDLIIDLQTNDHSRFLFSLVKLLGLNAPTFMLGNHSVYPYNIRYQRKSNIRHSFDIQRTAISSIGITPSTNHPILNINNKDVKEANSLLKKYSLSNNKYIIFIPGSNLKGKLKRWGVSNYRELSLIISQSMKQEIVLIGGKDDTEECLGIAVNNPNIINLCNLTKITHLPEIFRQSSLIISSDTGTAHLSGLSNTVTLLITGPTDPIKVMPIGQNIFAIQPDIKCKNCYLKICDHHSCMVNLKPLDVLKFINRIVS